MLTVSHDRHWYEPKLPHAVFINGFFAVMMRDHDLRIEALAGTNSLRVQFGGPLRLGKSYRSINLSLSSTTEVEVPRNGQVLCTFHEREQHIGLPFRQLRDGQKGRVAESVPSAR